MNQLSNSGNGTKTTKWLWIILIIVILAAAVFFAWFYSKNKVNPISPGSSNSITATSPTPSPTSDPTMNWQTVALDSPDATIKFPNDWKITQAADDQGIKSYFINYDEGKKTGEGYLYQYKLDEWLQGPSGDEGYVLSHDQRAKALQFMQQIYNDQAISSSSTEKFQNFGLEFFPYRATDTAGLTYIASKDNKSRGFSVIGTSGQDIGLTGDYVVSLYNSDNKTVLSIKFNISSATEIKTLNDKITDPATDKSAHQEFIQLIQSTGREKLSFGPTMDKIDLIVKSVKY